MTMRGESEEEDDIQYFDLFREMRPSVQKASKNLQNYVKVQDLFDMGDFEAGKLVYSPLMRRVYLLNEKTYSELFPKEAKATPGLAASMLFVDKSLDLLPKPPSDEMLAMRKESSRAHVSVFPTMNCNLKCVYCYSSGGDKVIQVSKEIARKAIDFNLTPGTKKLHIGFGSGGEPTLARPVIEDMFDYAETKVRKVSASITTNSAGSDSTLDWLLNDDRIKKVQVSCDGPPDVQDRQRPFRDGKPTSSLVGRTMKALVEAKKLSAVRSTVTPYSAERQTEMVDYFHDFGVPFVHFEPLFECGRSLKTNFTRPDMKVYVENLLKAAELAEHYGMRMNSTHLPSDTLKCVFCGTSSPMFNLTADGYITSCFEFPIGKDAPPEFIYGYYDHGKKDFVLYRDRMNRLQDRNIYNQPECQQCIAKWQCGGGCPAKGFQVSGNLLGTDAVDCKARRDGFRRYIGYRAEQRFKGLKPYVSGSKYVMYMSEKDFKKIEVSPGKIPEVKGDGLILFSFQLSEEDLNREAGEELVEFLEKLKKDGVDSRVTKPLPRCVLGEDYRSVTKKFRIPKSCYRCLELFTVAGKEVKICGGASMKLKDVRNRRQIYELFKESADMPETCISCLYHKRRKCKGMPCA
jgi:uncharacterized protein